MKKKKKTNKEIEENNLKKLKKKKHIGREGYDYKDSFHHPTQS